MKREKDKLKYIQKSLVEIKKRNLDIKFKEVSSPMDSWILINGVKYLNLCSNNYLGLANDDRLKKAAISAIKKYGISHTAVRTIIGTSKLHNTLEKKLAEFKKVESVILFQSGFTANLAVIPALVGQNDLIFSDELNHASIIDGCRLSKAEVIRYKHTDPADLDKNLQKYSKKACNKLIVTDGVFSMDGDIAPLDKIQKISEKYGCILMVDDAHGEGVLGKNGRGIVDHFKLHGKVDIEIGTMSKAFGVVGGYAAGNRTIIDWLKQRGRPFLFSSSLTVADTAACIKSIEILDGSDRLVKKLWDNAHYFQTKIKELGFDIGKTQTPITPIMLGQAKLAKRFSQLLYERKIVATAITYPTVSENGARIRIMISATHSKSDLNFAIANLNVIGKKLKVI